MKKRYFIREFLNIYLEAKSSYKKKKKNKGIVSTIPLSKPSGSIFFLDASFSENEVRKIVREIIKEKIYSQQTDLLSENVSGRMAVKVLPKTFDHLKWKLTADQKYFLEDFIHIHPDVLKDSDYEYASKKTGIPVKNIKSIQNTYGSWNKKEQVVLNDYGRFSVSSKKPLNAKEYEFDPKYRYDVVNFKKISKEEADELRFPKKSLKQKKYESDLIKSIGGSVKPSNTLKEVNYDDWVMYYIIGKLQPKDGRINERRKIVEIDFEPTQDYYDFERSMLNSNKKSKFWLDVEELLNEFNDVFGTSYMVRDQHDLTKSKSKCIRLEISELNVGDKMIWSAETQSYIPWDYAPIDLKKEYIKNRPENMVKKIEQTDIQDLLKKYLEFDKSMFQV